jgi:hypothetical protein
MTIAHAHGLWFISFHGPWVGCKKRDVPFVRCGERSVPLFQACSFKSEQTEKETKMTMRKFSCVAAVLIVAVLCVGQARAGTYYVSTKGDDAADGGSAKTAWRTIAHAAKTAVAGDAVLVAPGDYGDEKIVFANSGKKGSPIVVKGHGGRPILKSSDGKAFAFYVEGKSHIDIEGFDIFGYDKAVYVRRVSSHCRVRNLRCFGRGGAIKLENGVYCCRVDSCYIEDSYHNSICVHGDSFWGAKPCKFNTVANCTAVRGGHTSIDIHTCCPDTYVVGCVMRERGKERDGRVSSNGLYLHNHYIDRLRVIGNSVSDVYWGLELAGARDCILAENLFCHFVKADLDPSSFPDEGIPIAYCTGNTIKDNIIFDAGKSAMRMCGAFNNTILRNHSDGETKIPDYACGRSNNVDAVENAIIDPMRGNGKISVGAGGSFLLSYSPGLWPAGTIFRLVGGKTVEKTMGPDGANFGTLAPGNYTVRTILPGKTLPAPQYLRVMPLPKAESGAVIVWADCCGDETGFVVERKVAGQKDFKQIAKLKADTTRHIDKEIGKAKAIYRVRTIRGEQKSAWSNADEVVRYGYWFTNRTGLAVDGHSVDKSSAFGQVQAGVLKTLIVEKVRRVERQADAAEGISALALLEAGKPTAAWPKSAGAKGKAETWLVATKPVTATLRWRAGWIRGFVQCEGDYSLELHTAGQAVKSATFNGKAVKATFDKKTNCAGLDLPGSGALAIELAK